MASIHPFRGISFCPRCDLNKILVPPYDVISEEERERFIKQDPHNYVRLLLGDGENWHDGAAKIFQDWRKEKVLVQDDVPCFYRSEEEFIRPDTGAKVIRRGFFAAVSVEEYEKQVIRPHEKTHPGPKLDRLKLLKATHAQLDPI